MTIAAHELAAAPGREPGKCRYPGCPNQARPSDSPGRPPGYCGQEVPEDRDGIPVLVRHTAMTAFRRRERLSGQPADGRPVTAAITRAGAIRDDALAAVSRLSGQLAAVVDQLAVLGGQLAAAGDPEAAEAQAEAVRAETAAAVEHARAAAAEAVTMMEAQARDLDRAAETARQAARELTDARAEAGDAARLREEDRARHEAAAASLEGTVTALRDQLARTEAALDRERDRQHETVALLRGLITSPPQPGKPASRRPAAGS
jgi:hypothetical protein